MNPALPIATASIHIAALAMAAVLFSGTTSAQSPNPNAWTVEPGSVVPDKDFNLRILNPKYSGCGYTYQFPSGYVEGTVTLKVGFKPIKGLPACSSSTTLTGPTVPMKGLKAGSYAVMVWEQPPCYPDCHAIPNYVGPVDTLVVSSTTAAAPVPGASHARADRRPVQLRTGPGRKAAGPAKEILANGRAVAGTQLP